MSSLNLAQSLPSGSFQTFSPAKDDSCSICRCSATENPDRWVSHPSGEDHQHAFHEGCIRDSVRSILLQRQEWRIIANHFRVLRELPPPSPNPPNCPLCRREIDILSILPEDLASELRRGRERNENTPNLLSESGTGFYLNEEIMSGFALGILAMSLYSFYSLLHGGLPKFLPQLSLLGIALLFRRMAWRGFFSKFEIPFDRNLLDRYGIRFSSSRGTSLLSRIENDPVLLQRVCTQLKKETAKGWFANDRVIEKFQIGGLVQACEANGEEASLFSRKEFLREALLNTMRAIINVTEAVFSSLAFMTAWGTHLQVAGVNCWSVLISLVGCISTRAGRDLHVRQMTYLMDLEE
ncbi:MAG: hypothetical protein KR126chlam1_00321 [Chlamydiae bacterium]|nr:hypothetical protein [Chlamydiota bacterium]